MSADNSGYTSAWSREENKKFENGLAIYYEDSIDRWEKIAAHIPGKSVEEVKSHYELLIYDVDQIESGCVPLPDYETSSDNSMGREGDHRTGKKRGNSGQFNSNYSGKASRADQERRKGIAWTEDEHRLFLQGLEKYGKGDWRSISRNFVVTRTPTQVASHAQKYFIRLNSMNKDRRRSSIHDITNNNNGENSVRPGPITVQSQTSDSSAGGSSSKPSNQPHQSLATPSGVGIYGGTTMGPHQSAAAPSGIGMYGGATIGQPIGGPLGSAMGTPMNLPQPAHVAYGARAPVPGQVAPGAPVHMGHVAYHMPHGPHSSAHR